MSRIPNPTIRLRAVEPEDTEVMFECDNDEAAWPASDTVAPYSRHSLRQYALNYDPDPFASGQLRLIAENEAGEAVGLLDFYDISPIHGHAWVGIYVVGALRGNGYGKKILEAAISFASLRLGLQRLGARILTGNEASSRLFLTSGFLKSGTLPSWRFVEGAYLDMDLYVRML